MGVAIVKRLRAILVTFMSLVTLPVFAASSPWVGDNNAAVRLISAVDAVGSAGRIDLGLEFRFAPGWHGYWRSPGEAGLPPTADWSASRNLTSAFLAFPAPERASLLGIETFAYSKAVVMPVTATLETPGVAVEAVVTVDYLACAEICVPYQAELRLALSDGVVGPSKEAARLGEFTRLVPGPLEAYGLGLQSVVVGRDGGVDKLEVRIAGGRLSNPDLILEAPSNIGGTVPVMRRDGEDTVLTLALKGGTAADLVGKPITLTLIDGETLAEISALPVEGPVGSPPDWTGLIAIALLGGLILNLMPCVLPVLSLKLLSVVGAASEGAGAVRRGFLATSAGILVSFLALAGAVIGLKAAGLSVGWGIQFQQPVFLAGMAALVTLFTASLFGWVEILLPARLAGLGGARAKNPLLDQFLTGVVATLLATPCSAPFVGTAVGFAMAGSSGETLTIFTALAVGFAAPYLLVAAVPALARLMPRPGRWMLTLRVILGFGLLGTAVWLVSVLFATAGGPAALAVAGALVVAGFALKFRLHLAAVLALVFAFLGPLALPPVAVTTRPDALWQPWSAAAVAPLVAEGRVVLVDVTADWCLTCKVNKAAVLDRGAVAAKLASGEILGLKADWTRPDPAISAFLAQHGRYGIPFNIVYGPGAPGGITLPELLTEGAVIDALSRAAAPR
ncbi:protein-disulfide reductase DsbD family protein [Lacibacterium aquatile]|uniref:Protein-disulfide reductase DsbD family protein n=1 Tax=Lacibacterium aquatile TaxID=1168082 RepID=A0ABW5DMQ4_9PROT